ncbi:alkyl hydroperoxide reductase/ Thiol specific antioxidant/ Mal allergen [Fibrella aestuarina BUZ 2]|uniref:Alkyl hydroperoxide reductase/ Thiol specific antioxidant/ Mal allergen n=1 Tax=Fibrella aestuarina BUZ 2 TaxID=1166018 RepID=I0KH01_9BACT|nr:TlpA disulfide reductase family protein [Fibrella aestuarina]CCH03404.1 alkyl hydroperoxide reductase/ Thiol specific antioxidant/ Mal allergen [Fibrella aestuarina BUZ 2]
MTFRFSYLTFFFLVPLLVNCQSAPALKTGTWRATLQTSGGELPFGLDIQPAAEAGRYTVHAINGTERLAMDEAYVQNDSLHIPMLVFESELVGRVNGDRMTGVWRKRRTGNQYQIVPFTAQFGQAFRFAPRSGTSAGQSASRTVTGKWQTLFRATEGDTTIAVGVFSQQNGTVSGTFLTPTGDYRYLAGNVFGDSLFLSCFDGTHAFLFKAKLTKPQASAEQTMTGVFHSGPTYRETWTARLEPNAALPDPGKLTFVKPGQAFMFTFPDAQGKILSLNDPRFKGKVTVVQILGTWCPNCMDETRFLAPWYAKNRSRKVEVVGLAFEKTADLTESGPKIKRMAERFGVTYPVLLAGTNDKAEASKALPALNRVVAFPTTIFLDKKGQVRHIHTGFSGPGTGAYYDEYVAEFNRLVDKLEQE